MRKLLAVLALSAALVGTAHSAAAQVSFAVRIGPPPPPRPYIVPVRPAPGYVWVDGFWYPQGSHYVWRKGYWARPPYKGAYWVHPSYANGRYYGGHWANRAGGARYRSSRSRPSTHDWNDRRVRSRSTHGPTR